jgi:hypothetical protein
MGSTRVLNQKCLFLIRAFFEKVYGMTWYDRNYDITLPLAGVVTVSMNVTVPPTVNVTLTVAMTEFLVCVTVTVTIKIKVTVMVTVRVTENVTVTAR